MIGQKPAEFEIALNNLSRNVVHIRVWNIQQICILNNILVWFSKNIKKLKSLLKDTWWH